LPGGHATHTHNNNNKNLGEISQRGTLSPFSDKSIPKKQKSDEKGVKRKDVWVD